MIEITDYVCIAAYKVCENIRRRRTKWLTVVSNIFRH